MKKSKQILLVEDNDDLRQTLIDLIEQNGWSIRHASDGYSGNFMSYLSDFDLIITDIRMPKMNGLTMIDEIRKRKANIPIISITGFSQYSEETIYNTGCDKILHKPFSANELISAIEDLINKTEQFSKLKSS